MGRVYRTAEKPPTPNCIVELWGQYYGRWFFCHLGSKPVDLYLYPYWRSIDTRHPEEIIKEQEGE